MQEGLSHKNPRRQGRKGERGDSFKFAIKLSRLPEWMLYRGQVGGDLWHFLGKISRYHVLKVANSVSHLRNAWTYTHHKPDRYNTPTIREAIKRGFTINISTDGVKNKVLRRKASMMLSATSSVDCPLSALCRLIQTNLRSQGCDLCSVP